MTNAARGEVILKAGAKSYVLCLSLGALAEIEAELGVKDLSEIGTVLAKPNATQLGKLVLALIRGGASDDTPDREAQRAMTLEMVMQLPINVKMLTQKFTETFKVGMEDEESQSATSPQPEGSTQNPVGFVDGVGLGSDADSTQGVLAI